MPELPEVETVVRGLRPRVLRQRIVRLELHQPLIVHSNVDEFERGLTGAQVARLSRRGKYILFELRSLDNGRRPEWWIVHLGMTGQLYACPPAAPLLKHTHVVAWLSSGEQLRYCDPRRFGKMLLLPDAHLEEYFADLGPEPLRISLERFAALLAERRAPIKNLLLNQSRLRGLGNIYANEALFRARIHPARPASSLAPDEVKQLYAAVRRVLQRAIAEQGTTVSDYRTAEGAPGSYQNRLRVYDREGEPCPRCGAPIRRLVLAGRSAHYCPQCQQRRGQSRRRRKGAARARSHDRTTPPL